MRKLGLIFLFVALTGCGRGQIDILRAYNINPIRDASGKATTDLATQNRTSLQSAGQYTYIYVPPTQDDTDASASETADADEDTSAEDATLPEDAAEATSGDTQDVLDKIDALKQNVDSLKK